VRRYESFKQRSYGRAFVLEGTILEPGERLDDARDTQYMWRGRVRRVGVVGTGGETDTSFSGVLLWRFIF
jgi:hypothetical protein